MTRFLLVTLAGGVGSGARYLVALAAPRIAGTTFPWGTLAVNVLGCFVIAVIASLPPLSPTTRIVLGTGFCGGFTTYSAFNLETFKLVEQKQVGLALGYVLLTLVACAIAGVLGWLAARVP